MAPERAAPGHTLDRIAAAVGAADSMPFVAPRWRVESGTEAIKYGAKPYSRAATVTPATMPIVSAADT